MKELQKQSIFKGKKHQYKTQKIMEIFNRSTNSCGEEKTELIFQVSNLSLKLEKVSAKTNFKLQIKQGERFIDKSDEGLR